MEFKTSYERVKKTREYLIDTDASPNQSFLEMRDDDELVDPVYLLFNGEFFYCPDERCSIRACEEQEIRDHFELTHDSCFKKFFTKFLDKIIEITGRRVRHEDLMEKYDEEINQPVMELKQFQKNHSWGLLVCAICKDSFDRVKEAKNHKYEENHNIWIRRLETEFEDPRVSTE